MNIPASWCQPPREFSVMPFWFWNDDLNEREIVRQIEDMEAHGVYGFVIHPRVGLPRELGWMSERLLHFYAVAIEEARRRGMSVVLYDEGMYPSGSSSGQVVAANPAYQCRGLALIDAGAALPPDANMVATVPRGRPPHHGHRPTGRQLHPRPSLYRRRSRGGRAARGRHPQSGGHGSLHPPRLRRLRRALRPLLRDDDPRHLHRRTRPLGRLRERRLGHGPSYQARAASCPR